MVHIQYASDLHVDDFPKGTPFASFLTPVAPILVLAGDIANVWDPIFSNFIAWCSNNWYLVLFIAGNHEYYDKSGARHSMEQAEVELRAVAARFPNVVYLQNGASYVIPGTHIRFVGATLWSDVDPAIWAQIAGRKGDFRHIYVQSGLHVRQQHPADAVARHALHKLQLFRALAPWWPDETLIVITHHMPTWELLEEHYKGEALCSCYASHDDDLLVPSIFAWICGHSHRAAHWQAPRSGPLCVMNARGYNRPEEQLRTQDKYSPHATMQIGRIKGKK
jgi:hypothetical protein